MNLKAPVFAFYPLKPCHPFPAVLYVPLTDPSCFKEQDFQSWATFFKFAPTWPRIHEAEDGSVSSPPHLCLLNWGRALHSPEPDLL